METISKEKRKLKHFETERDGVKYRYGLYEFSSEGAASFKITLYGIRADIETKIGTESYKTGGLFVSFKKAVSFFDFLSKNLATPKNLPYLVEDSFCF
jgi:hypothetical protein